MKINEFVEKVNNQNFDIMNELQVKKYLPIAEKQLIAKGIIYECTERVGGAIKLNSVQQYLSYVKYMILRHTNLEYTQDDYDTLCSAGLLDTIMGCFGEDANECSRILNLMIDDYMQESTIEFAVTKFFDNVNNIVVDFANKLDKQIENMDLSSVIPKDMDADKLANFLNTYIK
jgi:hypothetical protein